MSARLCREFYDWMASVGVPRDMRESIMLNRPDVMRGETVVVVRECSIPQETCFEPPIVQIGFVEGKP